VPKITDRRFAKSYDNGQVFFGKWFANEGLTGIIPVIDTPSMVIIPKPGYSISEMARSLSLVVRILESDERFNRVVNGAALDDPLRPLNYVLGRLDQLSSEVSVMKSVVVERLRMSDGAGDE